MGKYFGQTRFSKEDLGDLAERKRDWRDAWLTTAAISGGVGLLGAATFNPIAGLIGGTVAVGTGLASLRANNQARYMQSKSDEMYRKEKETGDKYTYKALALPGRRIVKAN